MTDTAAGAFNFDHFIAAQDKDFAKAMSELRAGEKRSHWIWYIFPQLRGLRLSSTARRYGIESEAMARAYLDVPILRKRLFEGLDVVHEQIIAKKNHIEHLFGWDVDAQKVVSCFTLFGAVARASGDLELLAFAGKADEALDAAAAQGYPRCELTQEALRTGTLPDF